jgi:hypothetical protein
MYGYNKYTRLFTEDPKPIFDHFRNIAIVGALVIGAGLLKKIDIVGNPLYVNGIAKSSFWIIVIVAVLLLAMNTRFAQVSINTFFLIQRSLIHGVARLYRVSFCIRIRLFTLQLL